MYFIIFIIISLTCLLAARYFLSFRTELGLKFNDVLSFVFYFTQKFFFKIVHAIDFFCDKINAFLHLCALPPCLVLLGQDLQVCKLWPHHHLELNSTLKEPFHFQISFQLNFFYLLKPFSIHFQFCVFLLFLAQLNFKFIKVPVVRFIVRTYLFFIF